MKKMSLAILVSMSALTGAAYAQESTTITTITDPAKIAEIEQRAQALQQQREAQQSADAQQPVHHHHHPMKKAHKAKKAAAPEAASQ
jgi:hypothetical protein